MVGEKRRGCICFNGNKGQPRMRIHRGIFLQYGYDLFSMNSSLNFDVSFPKSQTGDLGVMIVSKYPIKKSSNFFAEDSIFYSRQLETIISVMIRL